jgi:hypothetical protein
MTTHPAAHTLCYTWTPLLDYDAESIWSIVQRHQGHIRARGDCIDFYIDREYSVLLTMAFPGLQRRYGDDLL